ncbi:MAG: hypothetical protein ACJ70R_08005 [Nitrososphaera sp.]|jgi:hypothetical protein
MGRGKEYKLLIYPEDINIFGIEKVAEGVPDLKFKVSSLIIA